MKVLHILHRYNPEQRTCISCSQGHFSNVPPLFHQGLRLNRTLVCLSLSNNQIGDVGATQLARVIIYLMLEDFVDRIIYWILHLFHQILGEFALTHEEAEERIKLMERKAVSQLLDLWVVPVHPAVQHLLRASGTWWRGCSPSLRWRREEP